MAADLTEILPEVCGRFADLLGEPCPADDRLFSSGRLDSVKLMAIIGWAESRYGVEVVPEELSMANFDTPRRLAGYLAGRLADGSGQPKPR